MPYQIERYINGVRVEEESFFTKRRHSPQAQTLLRRVMRRREKIRL